MEFLYGSIVEKIPPGVLPPEAWPEFGQIAGPAPICRKEIVGADPKGIRWSLWPLTFEEYVSDKEPDLTESKKGSLTRNRLILWKRISEHTVPAGWHQSGRSPWRIDGFHEFMDGRDYVSQWNHNARRDLKLWNERHFGKEYSIEEITLTEFEFAYKKSTSWRSAGAIMLGSLKRRLALPERKGTTILWGVRNNKTKEVIAGTAALFSSTCLGSVRECPFMLPEARRVYAATGLIDHWFSEAKKRGMRTLFFTHFWYDGEPQSWKGFSEFKSHFALQYVAYPPLLWRFERGSLF